MFCSMSRSICWSSSTSPLVAFCCTITLTRFEGSKFPSSSSGDLYEASKLIIAWETERMRVTVNWMEWPVEGPTHLNRLVVPVHQMVLDPYLSLGHHRFKTRLCYSCSLSSCHGEGRDKETRGIRVLGRRTRSEFRDKLSPEKSLVGHGIMNVAIRSFLGR